MIFDGAEVVHYWILPKLRRFLISYPYYYCLGGILLDGVLGHNIQSRIYSVKSF